MTLPDKYTTHDEAPREAAPPPKRPSSASLAPPFCSTTRGHADSMSPGTVQTGLLLLHRAAMTDRATKLGPGAYDVVAPRPVSAAAASARGGATAPRFFTPGGEQARTGVGPGAYAVQEIRPHVHGPVWGEYIEDTRPGGAAVGARGHTGATPRRKRVSGNGSGGGPGVLTASSVRQRLVTPYDDSWQWFPPPPVDATLGAGDERTRQALARWRTAATRQWALHDAHGGAPLLATTAAVSSAHGPGTVRGTVTDMSATGRRVADLHRAATALEKQVVRGAYQARAAADLAARQAARQQLDAAAAAVAALTRDDARLRVAALGRWLVLVVLARRALAHHAALERAHFLGRLATWSQTKMKVLHARMRAWVRGFRNRRFTAVVCLCQRVIRGWLVRRRIDAKRRAVAMVVPVLRAFAAGRVRRHFVRVQRSLRVVQAFLRRCVAQKRARGQWALRQWLAVVDKRVDAAAAAGTGLAGKKPLKSVLKNAKYAGGLYLLSPRVVF